MKKFRIIGLLLVVVVMSTLLEGCLRKGENDPFVSFRSRKARVTGTWSVADFTGDYLLKLNTGENRKILLAQVGNSVSETTEYINMSAKTQDSLSAGQDTIIEWKGKLVEAIYDFKKDGTFKYSYEYTLEKTHSKNYEEGNPDAITPFFPPYPGKAFSIDSTMTRNYRTEYVGRWNFLDDVDGYKNRERIILEIEDARFITNYAVTYVCDAEDDDGFWDLNDPVDTSFSSQSLQSVNHKYANGENSILWELDKLKNLEITMIRELDHIYTVASNDIFGYKHTEKGSELVELEQE